MILAAGCDPPGKPNPDDRPETPSQMLDFATLYKQNCSGCHGAEGNLGPAPPLNDPIFLSIITQEEILRVVHDGRPGTPMPPFARQADGALTEQQMKVLAAGILEHWKPKSKPAEPAPPYELAAGGDARSPSGDRARGAKVFAQACAGCHGTGGTGEDGDAGAINDHAFLSLISNQALRRLIITGRPDLGMPSYAEADGRPDDFKPLTTDQIDDLVALLAAWRVGSDVATNTQP